MAETTAKGKEKVSDDAVDSFIESCISSGEEYDEETDAPRFSFDQLFGEVPASLRWPRKSFRNLQDALAAKSDKDLRKVEHPLMKKKRLKRRDRYRLEVIEKSRKEKEEANPSALSAKHTPDEKHSTGDQESSKGARLGSQGQ